MTASEVRRQALAYLGDHHVMTLATAGAQGAWAAAVFYVNEGFDLFFLSAGHTRHATDIASDPHVAAAIHEETREWRAIKGIQLSGSALLLAGKTQRAAMRLYLRKFPFLTRPDRELLEAFRRVNWYRLRPEQLFFIDNSQGLGHRVEVTL